MAEKLPVQEQVDDEKRYKHKTGVIVQRYPLVAGVKMKMMEMHGGAGENWGNEESWVGNHYHC